MARRAFAAAALLLALLTSPSCGRKKTEETPLYAGPTEGTYPGGEEPVDERTGIRWKRIPAGTFDMGCSRETDAECQRSEQPIRHVTLSLDYLLAETETTNGQYRRCVLAGDCPLPGGWKGDVEKHLPRKFENFPVAGISHESAEAYCTWAGGRLPTEAEWERAARGGTDGRYPFPETSGRLANAEGTDGEDVFEYSSPVRSFPPNGFGLYDMAGNVAEFCADTSKPYDPKSLWVTDPFHHEEGMGYLARGGSWRSSMSGLRVSSRGLGVGRTVPSVYDWIGVRCARHAGPQ